VSVLRWFVAHTRPRREKKLVEYCARQTIAATLPCYDSAHKYWGKTVVFRKPLFPGYVFLQLDPSRKSIVRQTEHVANLLEVFEQEAFSRQLQGILLALEADLSVRLAPAIGAGMRVRIKSGPLQGIEGLVEQALRHEHRIAASGFHQPSGRCQAACRPPAADLNLSQRPPTS
jgi:transcription antitermination factor NusG